MPTLNIDTIINIYSIPLAPSTASGVINGIVPLSGIFGAVMTQHFVTKISRRVNEKTYRKYCYIRITLLTSLLSSSSLSITMLCFFVRMIQGVCIGYYVAMSPMIIRQLAPTKKAGTIGQIPQLFMTFCAAFVCVFQYCLSTVFDDRQTKIIWVYVLSFPLLTLTIRTLIFIYPYERPKYLISIGDKEGAKRLIQILYIDQYCQEVQMQKKQDLKSKIKHDKEISQLDQQIYGGHSIIMKLRSNASKIALIIAIVQQASGVNPASVYGFQIAKKSVESIRFLVPSIINSFQLVGTLMSSYLLHRYGRKDLFVYGAFALSFSHLSVSIGFIIQDLWKSDGTFFIMSDLVAFHLLFAMTIGPCTWLYISQVADPQVVPYAVATNRLSAFLATTFFPIITASLLNGDGSFIFLGFSLIMMYFSYFFEKYLVQSKGEQEKQLRMEFKTLNIFG